MIGRLSPGTLTYMQREAGAFLSHTYTRTSRIAVVDNPSTPSVDESVDDWGLPVTTVTTDVPGLPCLYMQRSVPDIRNTGLIVIDRPYVMVPTTDPLAAGDLVSNVVNAVTGTVELAGPIEVEDVDRNADAPLYHLAILRKVENV
jgi:hypothetical protein